MNEASDFFFFPVLANSVPKRDQNFSNFWLNSDQKMRKLLDCTEVEFTWEEMGMVNVIIRINVSAVFPAPELW